ncbi:PREDICTED: triacylglycerol lipase 2 isoform X2 [Tarenaya hassleriana]|uniref:triacylglycerol lipase 2 isoform X1 n=1 Tax=Tarenaya hassleriana TaxID=28532 RepID=UPI00053C51DF|nr:PREDICTED: triacylglycerol lipase 2 isoform X1 [Tarenaya hassleriana]XP_010524258.1 PREDICTED: triacylglycerol lipase 2 isoform X2 [Tarenaya hassleriana]
MAVLSGLIGSPLWVIILFLLLVKPLDGRGSSRGPFGWLAGSVAPAPSDGICATSVAVHGYICQEHEVTTRDGYILNMQRIPEGRVSNGKTTRQPVLIQHGVLVDGMTWLLNPAEQNLPLILAEEGFDVWIANTRGTRFSRRHNFLNPDEPTYWNWSWDELVTYDLPAFFDYVHSKTSQKIHYVGHSLGTLIALGALSEGRQVDKLRSVAMLSPIAYLDHMTTPLGDLAAKAFLGEFTTLLGVSEFNPKGEPVGSFLKSLCSRSGVDCYDLLSALTGKNCCLNASTVELFIKNEPQSTSTKNMVHLAQTVRDKVIAKYNYGRADYNLMHYGEVRPPAYNISAIPHDLPLFFSYGGSDSLSDVRDVELLLDSFKFHDINKISVQFVKDYAHADFIMGVNAKDIVYNQVVSFFKRQA